MRSQRLGAALLLGLLATLLALPVQAQQALDVAVRDTRLAADGTTEIVVNVRGSDLPDVLDPNAFSVSEQGQPVGDLAVEPFLQSAGRGDVVVSLVVDTSGSMQGEPIEQVRLAAAEAVTVLTDAGIAVSLIEFSTNASRLLPPTQDVDALLAAIDQLEAGGFTALYDAVIVATEDLEGLDGAQGNMVVLADGEDNRSEATIADAVQAAQDAEIPIIVIALETDILDVSALQPLASETGGRLVSAANTEVIGEVFADAVSDISSQYLLTYTSDVVEPSTLDLEVSVDAAGTTETIAYTVPNAREAGAAAPVPPTIIQPGSAGLLSDPIALWAVIAATFVAALLLFTLLFTSSRTVADRNLGEQLSRYIEGGEGRIGRSSEVAAHFRDRAMSVLENAPRPTGFDERLARLLEQAHWPLRNSEFLALTTLGGLASGLVIGLLSNWLGGLLVALIVGSIPLLIALNRREKRRSTFVGALPDTLQLMAGSLRAGYGILQSLDTVAKEAEPVVAEEFARVLTEARLGVPVETALELASDRIDNDDFRWVVLAINIQREVGGNLAELLDVVAEVLREREMLRRQIKVLSAEGRLSAIVLIALPIFLTLYLIIARPEYISVLVTSGFFGWAMVIGASVLMLGGVLWIRKLIQIEV
jgi:tight adherence protein B